MIVVEMDPRQNLTNLTCKVNRLAYKLIPVEYVPTSPTGTLVVNSELYVADNINVENCLNFVNNDNICIQIGTGTQPFGPYYPPDPYFQRGLSTHGPTGISWHSRSLPETRTPEWAEFQAAQRTYPDIVPRTDVNNNYSNITIGNESVPTASQDLYNIAIGFQAANSAIGETGETGGTGATGFYYTGQGLGNIAVGMQAGLQGQEYFNMAIGGGAGLQGQGGLNVAVGSAAAFEGQWGYNTAVGNEAGYRSQYDGNVAIGSFSAYDGQDSFNVAVGYNAGYHGQTQEAVAIGFNAASSGVSQSYRSIVIGANAGAATPLPQNSVAIGPLANVQGGVAGYNGLALGSGASSRNGAIILTSNDNGLMGATGTLYVNPLAQAPQTPNTYIMNYNTLNSQVGFQYQIQTGFTGSGSSGGTTTFSSPFSSRPNVTGNIVYNGNLALLTITNVTTTGFSWTKFYWNGSNWSPAVAENFSWIAIA